MKKTGSAWTISEGGIVWASWRGACGCERRRLRQAACGAGDVWSSHIEKSKKSPRRSAAGVKRVLSRSCDDGWAGR